MKVSNVLKREIVFELLALIFFISVSCYALVSLKGQEKGSITSYDDVVTIKINRKLDHSVLSIDEQNHITELEVDLYKDYDYIIENHAIEDLEKASIEIIRNEEDGE